MSRVIFQGAGSGRAASGKPPLESGPVELALLPRFSGVSRARPRVAGKFLYAGDEKLYLRGTTYGTFDPAANEDGYPPPDVIERDFALMAANRISAVRTYTFPPQRLLDAACRHGLWVLAGFAWEQHVAFLDDDDRADAIVERFRAFVRSCAGSPALLCYSIGNEIPAPIVRWHGPRSIERFLKRLYHAAKAEDPEGLVTYVNYPTTEYLHLPFLDLVCFNVFLEDEASFAHYLTHLHHVAGDRPLVMTEIGLDSRRNGLALQATTLEWQIRSAFEAGCAGAFAFAWTDEWHRGGHAIEDWDFGIVDRDRCPKPALTAVARAFEEAPFGPGILWPRITVVVCTYNGLRTIRETLDALTGMEYPDFEVVVVDDGSTDDTAAIAAEYDVNLIRTANRGLSSARNEGLDAASGEIIAYIDDDAWPDPDWLRFLALSFRNTDHAGIGGPNITPGTDGPIATCVASAPGGPIHVLLSDYEAEHIPGCNMAFRTEALRAINGFDARFRAAGDDVDVCWRIQDQGWTLGFSPAAMVWHHRRGSIRAYWKQQAGYGRAEAMLEKKWPERYNGLGHLTWSGWIYNDGLRRHWGRGKIYSGTWGSALFQSVYRVSPSLWWSLPTTPEWYLATVYLLAVGSMGQVWAPLRYALALCFIGVAIPATQALLCSWGAGSFYRVSHSRGERIKLRAITAFLHLLQPAARLAGRLRYGLTPWRRRNAVGFSFPQPRTVTVWSESWRAHTSWIRCLMNELRAHDARVECGGVYDRWDLAARYGMMGAARIRLTVEEHGEGKQLVRARAWPSCARVAAVGILLLTALSMGAINGPWLVGAALNVAAIILVLEMVWHTGVALAAVEHAMGTLRPPDAGPLA